MKLVISSDVAFDVRFTLNDAGKPVEFGFRVEAKRTDQPGISRPAGHATDETSTVGCKVKDVRPSAHPGRQFVRGAKK